MWLFLLYCSFISHLDGLGFQPRPDETPQSAFLKWNSQFQGSVPPEGNLLKLSRLNVDQKFKQFEDTFNFVYKKNKQKLGFKMELNKFSVMTESQLSQLTAVNVTELPPTSPTRHFLSSAPIPNSVDYRVKMGLSEPRSVDISQCSGSNWALVAVDVLESQYKLLTDEMALFSDQELLDCVQGGTCKSGHVGTAFQYLADSQRLADRRSYGYRGHQGTCHSTSHKNRLSRARVVKWESLPPGEDNLRREVATRGPLAVLIHATRSLFYYKQGIYDGNECSQQSKHGNHYVSLVGYKNDRWIIKNVWGDDWGRMNGYGYLSRKQQNCCKISNHPVLVTLALQNDADDMCIHVAEEERQVCWHAPTNADTEGRSACEAQGCCYDPNGVKHKCFIKGKITLYQGRNFQGAHVTFYGSVSNLQPFHFRDSVFSIKIHYGNFIFYSNVDFGKKGSKWENRALGVLGPGSYFDLDDYSMAHDISSLRLISTGKDILTLFEHTNGKGEHLVVNRYLGWVGNYWNDRASSAYASNTWSLCDDSWYKDCKMTIRGFKSELDELNDKISSVRRKY